MADRIVGALVLMISIGYVWGASALQVSLFSASDPLGPRAFPYVIAALTGLSSLWLLLRPDPNPQWPPGAFWLPFGLVLASLVAYAYLIVPLGFILTTTAEMTLLSVLFGARWWQGLGGALAFSLTVYFLFTGALGVTLPAGRIFG